ncbi:MAG TPA: tail fiber domain-containing protein [Rhodanobacteraceae bacterium]|jgi:hypothetical protein|nr:tail fiber domain-containing protein [Rhodanobacteraceae bacterium]
MHIAIRSTLMTAALLLAMGSTALQAGSFTYQGRLNDGGQPANGHYDLKIGLYGDEHSTVPLFPPVTVFGVDVHEGSFSTPLDFGNSAQNGGWIGVSVRPAGSGDFAALSGRSRVEPNGTCDSSWLLSGNVAIVGSPSVLGFSNEADLVFETNGAVAGMFHPIPSNGGSSFTAGAGHASANRSVSLNFGYAEASDSVAAGYSAVVAAGHSGSFVFGDDTAGDFTTTAPQQFIVRAGGGVGLNTNSLHFGSDDVVIAARQGSGADADSDLAFTTVSGFYGRIYLANDTGILNVYGDGGVHINNPVGIDGALDAKSLSIQGTASKSTAGGWKANSDVRIKQDIVPIANALDTLAKLRPVTFRYTDAYRADHAGIDDQRYYNVIAQEFAEVFPDAVKGSGEYLEGAPKTPDNEILQVDTYPAQIVAIAAVQELAQKNAALQAKVERLMARVEKLEAARGH